MMGATQNVQEEPSLERYAAKLRKVYGELKSIQEEIDKKETELSLLREQNETVYARGMDLKKQMMDYIVK